MSLDGAVRALKTGAMASASQTNRADDPLPDPIEWPRLPGAQRSFVTVIAGTVLLGLISVMLVGWTMGAWEAAAIYGALILSAAAIGYVSALGRARRGGGRVDWALVRAALGSRTDALAITDGAGRLVCANEAYGLRVGGYPSPFDLDEGGAAQGVIVELAARARRDGLAESEVELSAGDRLQLLRISARPAEATRKHLLWTLRLAPAERARARAAEHLEGSFGAWLGAADIALAMTNRDGRVLAANGAFHIATGRDKPLALTDVLDLSGASPSLRRADGSASPVRVTEMPVRGGEGEADSYLFLLQPQQSSGPLPQVVRGDIASLLSMLPLGLAVADRDGRLGYLNAAFAAAAGISDTSQVIYPTDLVIDEDKTLVSDAVRRAASRHGKPRDLRVRLKARPEEESVLSVARTPDTGSTDIILSLRDNREQLKLERQIAQATKMQAVGQLAGGVAHDFNNILTAVIGYCDLMMLRHTPGDADFDDINQIRQNANRAANLVRQLLAFSRQQTLRLQMLQVPDVIGELSHLLKRLLGERVTLTVKHGRNLGSVRADPGQLEQVIVNLAVNSRDAMPDGGELTISTYAVSAAESAKLGYDMMPAADYVVIAVKDTGTGIPADIIGKVFEPFFTTKEFGKGTGLGLSTVYGIVKQTGGFIFADSQAGKGTTFTIYLPVQAPELRLEPAERPPAAAVEAWGSGTILLVEDEAMVRAVAERALTRKGYTVLTAAHGEEALEILDRRPEGVDLLVSDVVMPMMDGPTLVRNARERFPDLKVIFMSGYAEEQLRKSIDVPSVVFLPKPFSVQELGEMVRATLARETA